jgi:hypothetical protein
VKFDYQRLLPGTLNPALEILELLLYGGSVLSKLLFDITSLLEGKTDINDLLKGNKGS